MTDNQFAFMADFMEGVARNGKDTMIRPIKLGDRYYAMIVTVGYSLSETNGEKKTNARVELTCVNDDGRLFNHFVNIPAIDIHEGPHYVEHNNQSL